ncbi:MAG: methionine--tRNA ligase, partial [Erysipelotrichaceae bacterium]
PDAIDEELIQLALQTPKTVKEHMETHHVQDAIDDILVLLKRCNKYIDETTPWNLAKEVKDKDRLETVLYNLLESIRFAAVLLQSFIPESATSILDQLNTKNRSLESLETFGNLESPKITDNPIILFKRLDLKEVLDKLVVPETNPLKPEISIDDFNKLDFRVGTIIECKNHPDSDKLLVSQVKIETKTIQIVSGLRPNYEAKDLVNLSVMVLVNLKAVKFRGVLSEGMLLVGEDKDKLEIIQFNQLKEGKVR